MWPKLHMHSFNFSWMREKHMGSSTEIQAVIWQNQIDCNGHVPTPSIVDVYVDKIEKKTATYSEMLISTVE